MTGAYISEDRSRKNDHTLPGSSQQDREDRVYPPEGGRGGYREIRLFSLRFLTEACPLRYEESTTYSYCERSSRAVWMSSDARDSISRSSHCISSFWRMKNPGFRGTKTWILRASGWRWSKYRPRYHMKESKILRNIRESWDEHLGVTRRGMEWKRTRENERLWFLICTFLRESASYRDSRCSDGFRPSSWLVTHLIANVILCRKWKQKIYTIYSVWYDSLRMGEFFLSVFREIYERSLSVVSRDCIQILLTYTLFIQKWFNKCPKK